MTLSARKPLPKKCAVSTCRAAFVPVKSFQTWCSPECGIVIARQKQEKERKSIQQRERREIAVRKEKLKSRADHLRRPRPHSTSSSAGETGTAPALVVAAFMMGSITPGITALSDPIPS